MRFLLDTCVISELIKPRPSRRVLKWVTDQPEERLYLRVLTLAEVVRGAKQLDEGREKRRLETWIQSDLKSRFVGRWLDVDEEVAERWGMLKAEAIRNGRPLPVIDAFIAATALVHGMTFVTRDESDVEASGVMLLNPWTSA